MVPAGNKAKRLLSVKHTTKAIHHHRHKMHKSAYKGVGGTPHVHVCYCTISSQVF